MLVIEHNLDVIRSADWLIDLGPEGGDAGGQIVVAGTPTQVEAHPHSHTGRALREYEAAVGAKALVPGRETGKTPASVRDASGDYDAFSRDSRPGTSSNFHRRSQRAGT
jgi:hypothetical protein